MFLTKISIRISIHFTKPKLFSPLRKPTCTQIVANITRRNNIGSKLLVLWIETHNQLMQLKGTNDCFLSTTTKYKPDYTEY